MDRLGRRAAEVNVRRRRARLGRERVPVLEDARPAAVRVHVSARALGVAERLEFGPRVHRLVKPPIGERRLPDVEAAHRGDRARDESFELRERRLSALEDRDLVDRPLPRPAGACAVADDQRAARVVVARADRRRRLGQPGPDRQRLERAGVEVHEIDRRVVRRRAGVVEDHRRIVRVPRDHRGSRLPCARRAAEIDGQF